MFIIWVCHLLNINSCIYGVIIRLIFFFLSFFLVCVCVCVCLQCDIVMRLNVTERCAFVKNTADCSSEDGFINYLRLAFCLLPPNLTPLTITLCVRPVCVCVCVCVTLYETLHLSTSQSFKEVDFAVGEELHVLKPLIYWAHSFHSLLNNGFL